MTKKELREAIRKEYGLLRYERNDIGAIRALQIRPKTTKDGVSIQAVEVHPFDIPERVYYDLPPMSEAKATHVCAQILDRAPGLGTVRGNNNGGIVFRPDTRPVTKAGEQRFRIPGKNETYDKDRRDHTNNSGNFSHYRRNGATNGQPLRDFKIDTSIPDGYETRPFSLNGIAAATDGSFTFEGKKPKKDDTFLIGDEPHVCEWLMELLWSLKGEPVSIYFRPFGENAKETEVLVCSWLRNGRYKSVATPA